VFRVERKGAGELLFGWTAADPRLTIASDLALEIPDDPAKTSA
jgi:hypothetical protein